MPRPSKTTTSATTEPAILSLDTIGAMEQPAQVALYVATEDRVRCGFLQQGKILRCLGTAGADLLRAAGIRPTTLANARNAEWLLDTFTRLTPAVMIHNGVEPTPFSEAFYDTLTLRQCDILRKAFSGMGTVAHRPAIAKSRELVQLADWDDNLETFFEHGTDLAGLAQRETDRLAAFNAEQERQAEMERQIAQMQAIQEAAAANPTAATPAPPPTVTFNVPADTPVSAVHSEEDEEDQAQENPDLEPEVTEEEETEAETETTPVQAIVEDTNNDEEQAEETEQETETEQQEQEEETASDQALTPEEVGSAVADATAGITTMAMWDQAFQALDTLSADLLSHADSSEREHMASHLANLLATVRPAAVTSAPKGRGSRHRVTA